MQPDLGLKEEENKRALNAKSDQGRKNAFLTSEQAHILHLTARILKRTVSMSDDEWPIALEATGEAIDFYNEEKGNFWNYAALVIASRLKDHYRRESRSRTEIAVGPEAFDSDLDEEPSGLSIEVRDKTAVVVDTRLRDELDAFSEEIKKFDIDLFDLPASAPGTAKTRSICARLIEAFFEPPPPLTDEMRQTGRLPAKELIKRTQITRKFIDKHRKYLIASALIKDGDYPGMASYLPTPE